MFELNRPLLGRKPGLGNVRYGNFVTDKYQQWQLGLSPGLEIPSAREIPTIIAVGVASPRAHGQAMTSTDTAANRLSSSTPVSANVIAKVTTAIAITVGTKMALILSTRR